MIIAVVILAVALILWYIFTQKALVSKDEMCANALSQIGVQLSSRWDAVSTLAKMVKNYSEHEYNTLMDVIGNRSEIKRSSAIEEVANQEDLLSNAASRIMAVSESYPELKANELYVKNMDLIKEYENNVRMSRMVYNDTVTKFNSMVRGLPSSIIAGFLGFEVKEYLKEDSSKADMPEV